MHCVFDCLFTVQGLEHIHGGRLKVHGRLKSNNVVIDGRWVCKLTDYGLVTLTADQMSDSEASRDALFSSTLQVTLYVLTHARIHTRIPTALL